MILHHVAFRLSCWTIRYCCFPELQFIFSSKSLFCWTECPSILLLLTTRFWDRLSYIGIQCHLLSGSAPFWGTCWLWWAYFYVISTDSKLSTSPGYDCLPNSKPQGQLRGSYYVICKSASMFFFQFEESACLVFWYQQYLRDVNQVMQHYFAGYLGFNFLHLCFVFSSLFPEKDY
jgi:hypothetical protein